MQLDRVATAYDGGEHAKHRLMGYHDFFVERIDAAERVLDVGCGKAELARDIAERSGARVTGIDFDEGYLAHARRRGLPERLDVELADALDYRPQEPFDVVVLSDVLEHIEQRPALLRALRDRTGARRFLIRVPVFERDWTVPLRKELGLPYFGDLTHFTDYVPGQLEEELRVAGLELVDQQLRSGEIWAEARVPE
ncbi:MAG: class I SAM-dependent methyltransferase [Deltaproteobacteria bacterium]|nr:class I SAM-dependent methyltransferase [Deltaproteobacteria bacterium]